MSLLTSASLILTSNGYKSGKLYSIVPSSGLGDFTFTRAASASRVNGSGLIQNVLPEVPRLDYSGSIPHWLLEPQKTNLVISSNLITNWSSNLSATKTYNHSLVSPEGLFSNAALITCPATIGSGYFQFPGNVLANSTYTFSVYVRNSQVATNIKIGCDTGTPTAYLIVNLGAGTITSTGAGIISSQIINSGNSWYRVTGTYTSLTNAPSFVIYNNQNTVSTQFLVYGAQFESGSYATSYIPTPTGAVTRTADILSVTGISSLIGQNQGTLFIEWAPGDLGLETNSNIMGLYSLNGNNRVILYFDAYGGIPHLTIEVTKSSVSTYFTPNITLTNTNFRKLAVVYKSNSIYLFENGVKIHTNNSTGVTFPLAQQLITFTPQPYNKTNKVRNAQIYPIALTDADCIALTTL